MNAITNPPAVIDPMALRKAVIGILHDLIQAACDAEGIVIIDLPPPVSADAHFFFCRTCKAVMPLSRALAKQCQSHAPCTGCPLPPDIF